MKKYLSFAVTVMAILGLGSLTSCHDEDLGVSTAVLQEHAFEQGFIKEFGKPSANQSFDFYAQRMQSLRGGAGATRATQAITFPTPTDVSQPTDKYFTDTLLAERIDKALKDGVDNSNTGQNTYSLVSTGVFNIYAVRYVGNIEKQSKYEFKFGMAYMDDTDGDNVEEEVPVELFSTHSVDNKNNPNLGKKVDFPVGKSFYFYLEYIDREYSSYRRRFYSNQTPAIITGSHTEWVEDDSWFGYHQETVYDYTYYTKFGGTSTLLYSTSKANKQYMLIGFEDGWGFQNNRPTGSPQPDYDFNDIVIILEGSLPEPSSKRFFCEDLQSYDWDYNDVVFDVTSRGVVLRAVGGTLPVYLEIEDKKGVKHLYGELHELMWENQSAEEKRKHPFKTFVKDGKAYYKPIRVGAEPGLAIEAVELEPAWDYENMTGSSNNGLALTDDELIRFANPKVEAPATSIGGIRLFVLKDKDKLPATAVDDKIQVNEEDIVELSSVGVDGSFTVINPYQGTAPAIWSASSSVAWAKEMVKITKAYPAFYGGGSVDDPMTGGMPMWWNINVNLGNTYQFSGDVDPDRVN